MKKFQFTLQKLMDFRQQELDRQKNTLSALQAELQRIYQEKEELIRRVEESSQDLEIICRQGAQVFEVSVRKRYIVSLQQEIHAHDASAAMKQQEINKQLGVVVEATKDVRTLEKLEEKQLEDYKAAANKENEQFIEEFVSGQSIRAHNEQRI
ncbi:MAG TPA: flagellar export protein FliJ [Ruminococcaceae bacterium]|nr:flagellar export protein FliJ [Oscillospiraceae bacterium]